MLDISFIMTFNRQGRIEHYDNTNSATDRITYVCSTLTRFATMQTHTCGHYLITLYKSISFYNLKKNHMKFYVLL